MESFSFSPGFHAPTVYGTEIQGMEHDVEYQVNMPTTDIFTRTYHNKLHRKKPV